MTQKIKKTKINQLEARPPVVVVLGHVDHGKTTLLDQIRKAHIAQNESGGITQHIGAYNIEYKEKKITFIDTPGHEAFSAMRARGAKVADIAILVVAADEGLKPQTKEAIEHIKKAGIAMIVAINKIDKSEAQPEKIKNQLMQEGIVVESLGGDVPALNVSAKTGEGIDDLLEMINLISEMRELKFDPQKVAEGVVIEARLDPLRGPTATLLVRDGILKMDDLVATGTTFGKVKILEDFKGKILNEASASEPVVVVGLDDVPEVGDKFIIEETQDEARARVEEKTKKRSEQREVLEIGTGKKIINLIIKVDVQGSLEPIRESLKIIPQEEVLLRILKESVGDITDSDVSLAEVAKALILGFRVKALPEAKSLAEHRGVEIKTFDIIYELVQVIRALMSSFLKPETLRHDLGKLRVLTIFKKEKGKMIIGGKVSQGEIKKGVSLDVFRLKEKIGTGKVSQLQRDKKDVDKVAAGQECGIMFSGDADIKEGDTLEAYEEEQKNREV